MVKVIFTLKMTFILKVIHHGEGDLYIEGDLYYSEGNDEDKGRVTGFK